MNHRPTPAKRRFTHFFAIPLAVWTAGETFASAGEVYPPQAAVQRIYGIDQALVGSCWAEAITTALENSFAARGYSDVRLSNWYSHVYNKKNQNPSEDPEIRLSPLTEADKETLSKGGAIIPDYMFPEDGSGINQYSMQNRPSVGAMAIIPPDWRTPDEDAGYEVKRYELAQIGSQETSKNKDVIETIKRLVDSRAPIVFSIHNHLFYIANPQTGLMPDYSISKITNSTADPEPINHAAAAVGYDDSIYSDSGFEIPGAFILRNSWNNSNEIIASNGIDNRKNADDLKKFKNKLNPNINLPGYIAVPYQYFLDSLRLSKSDDPILAKQWSARYSVISLDLDKFASAYRSFKNRYEVSIIPFICRYSSESTESIEETLVRFRHAYEIMTDKSKTTIARRKARSTIDAITGGELQSRVFAGTSSRTFQFYYARIISSYDGTNGKLTDFENGAFESFYCPPVDGKRGEVWPSRDWLKSSEFLSLIIRMKADSISERDWYQYYKLISAFYYFAGKSLESLMIDDRFEEGEDVR